MSIFDYDLDALRNCAEFDAEIAAAYFSDDDSFFDKLDEYVADCPRYLRDYNPAVVIYGPEVRLEFTEDMVRIRAILSTLQMTAALKELDNIAEAVENENTKELSDGLVKFHAVLEMAANDIISARTQSQQSDYEKPVIIAVDDMPEILTTIRGVLESEYKVIGLTSAASALEAAKLHMPSLFLLDIEMPEISGIDLAREIRAHGQFNDTPILFLSGKSDRDKVIAAKNLGIKGYILKPVNKDILLNRITACLK